MVLSYLKLSFCFSFLSLYLWNSVLESVEGGGICKEGLSLCVGNIFYIGDLDIIFNEVFEWSRLVLPEILRILFQTVLVDEMSLFT